MPQTQPINNYYRFGGWFIDTDGNGILDNGETILPQDYRFTAPATITAHFEENPDAWININFAAGSHGSIDAGESLTLRTTFDKKWGDITSSLPAYTPEVNYLVDDWYVQGRTCGRRYVPDQRPDLYHPVLSGPRPSSGTEVKDPEPAAGLNSQGKGRVTVFGTTQGYKYILTDLDGKVLEVNKGIYSQAAPYLTVCIRYALSGVRGDRPDKSPDRSYDRDCRRYAEQRCGGIDAGRGYQL